MTLVSELKVGDDFLSPVRFAVLHVYEITRDTLDTTEYLIRISEPPRPVWVLYPGSLEVTLTHT